MGKKGEKNIKKSSKSILIGYIICIIAIIISTIIMSNRKEKGKSEAIDFTTNGAIDLEIGKLAYLDIQGLSEEVENKCCIAYNKGYTYIVNLNLEKIELLKPWKEYIASKENISEPEPIKIYGTIEKIPEELKQKILDFSNKDVPEAQQIKMEEFQIYFGNVLLNAKQETVKTAVEEIIIFLSICAIVALTIIHILKRGKTKKYKIKRASQ